MAYLNFADAMILESGGWIYDQNLAENQEWFERLQPERGYLAEVGARLTGAGWVLDDAGRTSAIRVWKTDNPHKLEAEFERLCREIELPDALKKTINMEHLDIILKSAGNENAVRFWMQTNGYSSAQSGWDNPSASAATLTTCSF